MNRKYIAIDTESTGFQPNSNYSKLLEIGAVKVENDKIVDHYDRLINPGMKIPKQIVELTHITDEMVANEKDYCEVLSDFRNWCGEGYTFIFHNATHDLKFLNHFGKDAGVAFNEEVIDTMKLATKAMKKFHPEYKTASGRTDTKLSTLAKVYGIPDPSHHRANNDAELTWRVFKALQSELKSNDEVDVKKSKTPENAKETVTGGTVTVTKVRYWEKKKIKRIYVNLRFSKEKETSYATVYYDFGYKNWGIKETFFPIKDFKEIERQVLKMYNATTLEEKVFI